VPTQARRVLGAVMAVLGMVLAAMGAWTAIKLGPSGEVHFSATSKATGAVVVGPDVLNSLNVPVRIRATRSDGGAVWLATGPSDDARAVLATSAVSTVSGVHYPAGTLDLRSSGAGALPRIGTSDAWRLRTRGSGPTELVVDQGTGPETAVVTSGDATALTNVTMTLTWQERSWFFKALSVAVIGAIIAAFALGDLSHSRHTSRRTDGVRSRRSRVSA